MKSSAVTMWINCQLSPVTCSLLNLTLLPIEVGSLGCPRDLEQHGVVILAFLAQVFTKLLLLQKNLDFF